MRTAEVMTVELRFEAASTGEVVDVERIKRAAGLLLEEVGCSADELSIAMVSDDEIGRLNRVYRSLDRPTDVLSFAIDEREDDGETVAASGHATTVGGKAEGVLLGDVVISLDTASRQALAGGWSLEEELNRLLMHGLLHLLGFDHEQGGDEEVRMRAEERRLATALGRAGFGCAAEDGE